MTKQTQTKDTLTTGLKSTMIISHQVTKAKPTHETSCALNTPQRMFDFQDSLQNRGPHSGVDDNSSILEHNAVSSGK
jgi:hypothetical protein